jgi:hypothetical protein
MVSWELLALQRLHILPKDVCVLKVIAVSSTCAVAIYEDVAQQRRGVPMKLHVENATRTKKPSLPIGFRVSSIPCFLHHHRSNIESSIALVLAES